MDPFKRATLPDGGDWRNPCEKPGREMKDEMKRIARRRMARDLRKEPTEPELHEAEIELIACEAGNCPLGCGR